MRGLALTLVALVLTAGCVGAPEGSDAATDAAAGAARERTGWFSADMTLAEAAPAESAGVGAGSFFLAWAEGADYPTWLDAPASEAVLVTNVTSKLFLRATGPVVESGRFPDVMIYGGVGDSWMAIATTKFASVLVPGEVHEIDLELELPPGGLVLPPGESLGFKVVPVMHQSDAADVEILVGGDTASRATWTQAPIAPAAPSTLAHGDARGETVGSAYAGEAAPESTSFRHAVPLDAAPSAFLVWMNTTDAAGVPDIDLSLELPDGEVVAFSGTPTPREFLRLHARNFEGAGAGEYVIVVTSYGSARSAFTIEWLVG